MHFDPKIQNLLITVYYFQLMSSLLYMQISLGYAYTLEFTGIRPGIYWATPWNLLGYALEFTGLCLGIYYYTGRQPHTGEYDGI